MSNKLDHGNSSPSLASSPSRVNSLLTSANPMKGRIKRETGLFSTWKERTFTIKHSSQLELTLTIEKSGKT